VLIGPVTRPAVLDYLAGELAWGLEHASEPYAVLNACRGLQYAASGQIVSKVAGGHGALARGLGPPAVIRRALDQQLGLIPAQPAAPDAISFVTAATAALRAAAEDPGTVRSSAGHSWPKCCVHHRRGPSCRPTPIARARGARIAAR
jgi:hypothetical protein